MSHFTTHHLFGQQVLKDAAPQAVRTIELNLSAFCWGLQGADLLYTHRHVNEYSELPTYGRLIHGEKTNTLFTFLAHDLLSHRKCTDFDTLMAYFYGFCCHYALDCKLHPYVFSLQKRVEDAAGDPKHFAGVHWHIEDGIDHELSACLDRFVPPATVSDDYYMTDRNVRRTIGGLYSRILWNVYGIRTRAASVEECFIDGIWKTDMIYREDGSLKPHAIMNQQVLKSCPDFRSFFADAVPTDVDCLNLKHSTWQHHGDHIARTDSVLDMMEQAKELALTLWDLGTLAIHQGNRHLITNFDFSRSFVDGKFRD